MKIVGCFLYNFTSICENRTVHFKVTTCSLFFVFWLEISPNKSSILEPIYSFKCCSHQVLPFDMFFVKIWNKPLKIHNFLFFIFFLFKVPHFLSIFFGGGRDWWGMCSQVKNIFPLEPQISLNLVSRDVVWTIICINWFTTLVYTSFFEQVANRSGFRKKWGLGDW